MLRLLGESRIIDDPGLNRYVPVPLRYHDVTYVDLLELVRPTSSADNMQHRLMLRRNTRRRRDRRHWFHALAFKRQQQAYAIGLQRRHAIRVADDTSQFLNK